jgi:hypothetical protein
MNYILPDISVCDRVKWSGAGLYSVIGRGSENSFMTGGSDGQSIVLLRSKNKIEIGVTDGIKYRLLRPKINWNRCDQWNKV